MSEASPLFGMKEDLPEKSDNIGIFSSSLPHLSRLISLCIYSLLYSVYQRYTLLRKKHFELVNNRPVLDAAKTLFFTGCSGYFLSQREAVMSLSRNRIFKAVAFSQIRAKISLFTCCI